MSILSHSQAGAVHYRSTDPERHSTKDHPPSYDAVTGQQAGERTTAGDAPSVKEIRNGVSEAALSTGRGNEERQGNFSNVQKHTGSSFSGANAPRPAANNAGAQAVVAAAKVNPNLPSAGELRKQIAQFVQKNLSKDAGKAAQIASRIPTNDQVRLNNILENLKLIKGDNGRNYESLKKDLSWSSGCCYAEESLAMTTADQRLTLRGLMLFMLSDLEPALYDRDPRRFAIITGGITSLCALAIKVLSIEKLNEELVDAKNHINMAPVGSKPYIETLPVVISSIRQML